ncbi:MAG: DUF2127 domain-containing protein [Chloroflexi bacterium]|nr:DUF2127 domain-containing protein [Chloroflexota bacterium]
MVSTDAAPTTTAVTPPKAHAAEGEPMTLGLMLIVIFKGVTAVLLWAAFALLVMARQSNPQDFFSHLVRMVFHGDDPDLAVRFIAMNTKFITHAVITRVAIAFAAYALVESTEAIGLWMRKMWAEWLVIMVTISFIPFELYELVLRPNPWKGATLAGNLVILWYLLRRVLAKRQARARR